MQPKNLVDGGSCLSKAVGEFTLPTMQTLAGVRRKNFLRRPVLKEVPDDRVLLLKFCFELFES